MTSELKILFITDMHLSYTNVEKLALWHKKNQIKFDILLVGGDTANCDQNDKSHSEEQQLKETNQMLAQVQEIFDCKTYFIPGNHDPLTHYEKGCHIRDSIESLHERRVVIAEGLEIFGFGGSVPGYLDKGLTNQIWKGYPFNSNQALSEYCEQNKLFTQDKQDQNQRIYLTHCGPLDYETSIDRRNPASPIYAGAEYFNKLVEHDNLILYLHGHCHYGSRYSRVKEVPIINPGPLLGGQFGYIKLLKNEETEKWQYSSSHFVQL